MDKAFFLAFFLIVAIASVYFTAFYALSNFHPNPAIIQMSEFGAAPPEDNGIPFAAGVGIAMLLVLSALAWYIPIGFGRKKTGKTGKRWRPR